MDKKKRTALAVFGGAALIFLVGALCTGGGEKHESIQEVMRDAVLHESAKIDLFGMLSVNPGLISAFTVTGVLLDSDYPGIEFSLKPFCQNIYRTSELAGEDIIRELVSKRV